MSQLSIERRIFIVGVPRSGTTLVQSLLAAHSGLTSFTESHFFSRHFRTLPGLATPMLRRDPAPRVHEFLAENHVTPSTIAAAAAPFPLGRRRPVWTLWRQSTTVAQQLLRLLDAMAAVRGQSCWVEKTPQHLHYLPCLDRLSRHGPRTHYVHVLRGGLETVASLHRASQDWPTSYDLATCVQRWNRDMALSLRRSRRRVASSSTDHFVIYEELTRSPESVLRRLLNELVLPWEPEVLVRYRASSKGLITRRETWKTKVDRPMRPSATSATALSDEQRRWVDSRLRHDLYQRLQQRVAASNLL